MVARERRRQLDGNDARREDVPRTAFVLVAKALDLLEDPLRRQRFRTREQEHGLSAAQALLEVLLDDIAGPNPFPIEEDVEIR